MAPRAVVGPQVLLDVFPDGRMRHEVKDAEQVLHVVFPRGPKRQENIQWPTWLEISYPERENRIHT